MKKVFWIGRDFRYKRATIEETKTLHKLWRLIGMGIHHQHLFRRIYREDEVCFICIFCLYQESIPRRIYRKEKRE